MNTVIPQTRYLFLCSFFCLLNLATVAAFNWLMDPYWIYGSPVFAGFNKRKTEFANNTRMAKAGIVRRLKPRSIILGTSRAEAGLDPEHSGWDPTARPCYNLGLPGANIYETYRYFQHAQAAQSLRQVVLAVDFFMFNADLPNRIDFEESRLLLKPDGRPNPVDVRDILQTLFSMDSLYSSFRTWRGQGSGNAELYLPDGRREWNEHFLNLKSKGGHGMRFIRTEQEYSQKLWFPPPTGQYRFTDRKGCSSFNFYRQILEAAHRNHMDLRLLISPAHAHLDETLRACGLWASFEAWKRELVRLNEWEAKRVGANPFPVWDFNDFNSLDIEEVPPLGDVESTMNGFWDAAHYKKALGNLVLDRIFGHHEQGREIPEDFGILLTSANVEQHLEATRKREALYRAIHPSDIAAIEKLAAEAADDRKKGRFTAN